MHSSLLTCISVMSSMVAIGAGALDWSIGLQVYLYSFRPKWCSPRRTNLAYKRYSTSVALTPTNVDMAAARAFHLLGASSNPSADENPTNAVGNQEARYKTRFKCPLTFCLSVFVSHPFGCRTVIDSSDSRPTPEEPHVGMPLSSHYLAGMHWPWRPWQWTCTSETVSESGPQESCWPHMLDQTSL